MVFSQADFCCGRCRCLWILKGRLHGVCSEFGIFWCCSLGGPHQLCRSQRRLGWVPASFQFHDMQPCMNHHQKHHEKYHDMQGTKNGKDWKLVMTAGERARCRLKDFHCNAICPKDEQKVSIGPNTTCRGPKHDTTCSMCFALQTQMISPKGRKQQESRLK